MSGLTVQLFRFEGWVLAALWLQSVAAQATACPRSTASGSKEMPLMVTPGDLASLVIQKIFDLKNLVHEVDLNIEECTYLTQRLTRYLSDGTAAGGIYTQ